MTPGQQASFTDQGYLYLPRALARSAVQPVKAYVLHELKRLNIWAGGRSLSTRLKDMPIFQQTGKLGQLINYPHLKTRIISQELLSDMRKLAGAELTPEQHAQLLLSLPHKEGWTLAGLNWHRDISVSTVPRLPGVQAFVLIDDVLPHGGATLALAGSHKLRKQLQGRQGIGALLNESTGSKVMVDDTELSVLEMAGCAGDVYLMDMRLLHTPSINATRHVRMMATIRYFTNRAH